MTENSITISPGSRFRTAMLLAIAADALQVVVFPLFAPGALSPADDLPASPPVVESLSVGIGGHSTYRIALLASNIWQKSVQARRLASAGASLG